MLDEDDYVYLTHIMQCIERIDEYMQNKDYTDFVKTNMLQDALARQVEIIGEASKRLSKPFKLTYFHIDWRAIAEMRDKLVHDYFGVDKDIVWETVSLYLPVLKENVLRIFKDENREYPPTS